MNIFKVDLNDKIFRLDSDHELATMFYEELFMEGVSFISNHRSFKNEGENSHYELETVIEAFKAGEKLDGLEIVPVNAYEHGNIMLSLGSFSCPWDSGVFGFLLFKPGEFGENNCGLKGFVHGWSEIINGNIYAFSLEEKNKCECCGNVDLEMTDSCGGFYGFESNGEMVKEMLNMTEIELTEEEKQKILDAA